MDIDNDHNCNWCGKENITEHSYVYGKCACGAKIDSPVQIIGIQLLAGTTAQSESTSIRLVLSLTSDDLSVIDNIGLYASLSANAVAGKKYSTNTVYESIKADGTVIPAADGTYFVLVEISNIKRANFDTEIFVRPFITTADGETLGAEVSFSVAGILG